MSQQASHDREENNRDDENTFRILVATDCHLGYKENDPVRSNDSLNTFEEILQHAESRKVDMILLGGDLFHHNKPTRKTLHKCMTLLRQFCKGNTPVHFKYVKDPNINSCLKQFPLVDYADPRGQNGIPVFSIHGNHDNPVGSASLSALDVLKVAGLVNYFGKIPPIGDEVFKISPLLMEKGTTKLAIYGLGSIRDVRLNQKFRDKKISLLRPNNNSDSFYNLFVIHQNRAANRGEENYIPEHFLDNFIDLVIWGHEHDCQVEPVKSSTRNFQISQPGSSIATSLAYGESKQKHVACIQITGKRMELEKIPLQTVRPFHFKDITLRKPCYALDPNDDDVEKEVEALCTRKIEKLLRKADRDYSNNPQKLSPPLIRLRIDHGGGFPTFNVKRLGREYVKKVANPEDIIRFYIEETKTTSGEGEGAEIQSYPGPGTLKIDKVEDLVKEYFKNAEEARQMKILEVDSMIDATGVFVSKEDNGAIGKLVKEEMEKAKEKAKLEATAAAMKSQKRKADVQHKSPKKERRDEDVN